MILVTGAAGKTGRAVIKALLKKNAAVRALVRRTEQAEELLFMGVASAVVGGDLSEPAGFNLAMDGINSVYHLCPNMHPAEINIGRLAIQAALECGVSHFVYHSVLHPQTEKMIHHWQKMRVEELLSESGLNFTILQPAPYMQNILAGRDSIVKSGLYRVPYPPQASISLVDLEDLGEAAALVLTEPGHSGSIYEIVGTAALTQAQTAAQISKALGRDVNVEEIELTAWRSGAEKAGLDNYALEGLYNMFRYYALYGLTGNPNILRCLLGREPNSIADFVRREFV